MGRPYRYYTDNGHFAMRKEKKNIRVEESNRRETLGKRM
jgi:hypothetical protein